MRWRVIIIQKGIAFVTIALRHNHLPEHTSYDPCEARELYVIESQP